MFQVSGSMSAKTGVAFSNRAQLAVATNVNGRGQDLVAGADPVGLDRQVQAGRAAVEGDGMLAAEPLAEGRLELGDGRPEGQTVGS